VNVWVILPILVAGFIFNSTWIVTSYFSRKNNGQKLFFMSAVSGLVIAGFASPLWELINYAFLIELHYHQIIQQSVLADREWLVLLVILAFIAGLFFNLMSMITAAARELVNNGAQVSLSWSALKPAIIRSLNLENGTLLVKTLYYASETGQSVLVTLKSRKVYCGYLVDIPDYAKDDEVTHLEILPAFSSYRKSRSLDLADERLDYPIADIYEARGMRSQLERSIQALDEFPNQLQRESVFISFRNELDTQLSKVKDSIEQLNDYWRAAEYKDWVKLIPTNEIESVAIFDRHQVNLDLTSTEPTE